MATGDILGVGAPLAAGEFLYDFSLFVPYPAR
jgi:hypothetical protein